jgi:hypothetical protein
MIGMNAGGAVVWILLIVLALLIAMKPARGSDARRALKFAARRLEGRYDPGGWMGPPGVEWNFEGVACRLSVRSDGAYTPGGVTVRFRRPCAARLRLAPENAWWKVRKFFGAADIRIGDADFDRTFVIQADNGAWARRVLTAEIRALAMNLDRTQGFGLDLGPAGIVIRTGSSISEGPLERLSMFVREALALGLAIHRVLDPAMVVSEMELTLKGICPVCGTPVEGEGGLCSRCRTLHHRDCWDYLGGCAVFGCAGRPRRVRGRVAPARADSR